MGTRRPIVILGAARSGTKLLRDLLAASSAVAAVPYDINYIWRRGSERLPHDEIPPTAATPDTINFIRGQVDRLSRAESTAQRPIEKTVSNPLRLPYVVRVYPDADYVWLLRDGRDVAESTMRCWLEPPDGSALFRKLREMPWRHTYRYAGEHGLRLLKQRVGGRGTLNSWGPRYRGIDDDVRSKTLAEVSALQWVRTVESFEANRGVLPSVHTVRYEDLVRGPSKTMQGLAEALDLPDAELVAKLAEATVRPGRIGTYGDLPVEAREQIASVLHRTLSELRYTSED